MKVKDEERAKHGANNTKRMQEATVSNDRKRQREADVEDTEASAKKQAKKQNKSAS